MPSSMCRSNSRLFRCFLASRTCLPRTVLSSSLPDVLATLLPGSRTNSSPAALKLNMVYSVLRATPRQIAVAKGREAEVAFRKLEGLRIKDAIKGLDRDELDLIVEVNLPRKKAKPGQKRRASQKPGQTTARFRVVGVRHPQSGDLHLYVTNIMDLDPEQVRVAYTARWAVELFFDECKNVCRMNAMPNERKKVVEILVYAALLRMLCCRAMLDAILKRLETEAKHHGSTAQRQAIADALDDRLSLRRASRIVVAYRPRLLQELIAFLGLEPI